MNQSLVPHSDRVGWIASLMKQLLEEVRAAPVGVVARTRIAQIHSRSVSRVERRMALDVLNEIAAITLPFCGQERRDSEPGVQDRRGGSRIDRILENIETSQSGQQRQRQRKADATRSAEAAIAHTAREGASRDAADRPCDDSSNYLG